MVFFNTKDRKILEELNKNSRQTDSEISKKVGISKQVANYRIKRLLDCGVIDHFYTIVNVGKLGLNSYYVFLQFQSLNEDKERELLKKINKKDYIGWLVSGTGRWDAVLLVFADTYSTFDILLNEILSLCGEYLHEYCFTTLITAEHLSYKFLNKSEGKSVRLTEKENLIKLDNIDFKILSNISQNARESIVNIAEQTKIPIHVVNYHLKNLIKNKIIEGFKPKININNLALQWHLLLIQFQNVSEERKKHFISFCKQHINVYYLTNTIGMYNLSLDIHVNNTMEFKQTLLDLKEKFSDVIKNYESIIIFDEYKISYFPEELLKRIN